MWSERVADERRVRLGRGDSRCCAELVLLGVRADAGAGGVAGGAVGRQVHAGVCSAGPRPVLTTHAPGGQEGRRLGAGLAAGAYGPGTGQCLISVRSNN